MEYQTNLIYSLASISWAGFQLSQRWSTQN